MRKIITVDGPAGSGKSTIAKLLANRLGYSYLDTGAIYRCITLYFIEKEIKSHKGKEIKEELSSIKITIDKEVFKLNSKDVTEEIRGDNVTKETPIYAKNLDIRSYVKKDAKKIAESDNFVIDGRDIGSVVFKDAFCKFYLDASVDIRAKRRHEDPKAKSEKNLEEIKKEVSQRDQVDKTRKDSPLVIPVDAHLIDTTNLKIEEVLEKMIEQYNFSVSLQSASGKVKVDQTDSSKLFFDALNNISDDQIEKGSIVKAKIIQFFDDRIILDMGDKKDGFIQGEEIDKIKTDFKVGDDIIVYVIGFVNNHSEILASHKEANKRGAVVKFTTYLEEKKLLEGEIIHSTMDGFVVEVEEVSCYCYFSDYDDKHNFFIRDEVGTKKSFYIKSINNSRILLTRIEIATQKREKEFEDFFSKYGEGDIIQVEVKRFLKYGVYVTYSESVGFVIRNKDISWARFKEISKVLTLGEKISVKIVGIERDKNKVFLSKKEVDPNPIDAFFVTHQEGEVLEGRVRSFLDFGVFIELEPGVDGLLHISEISWTEKVDKPSDYFSLDQVMDVKILKLNPQERRISLGYKQIQVNPWDDIEVEQAIGSVALLKVEEVTKNRVFFESKKDFKYVLHYSNYSWSDKRIDLEDHYKVGEEYEVKIIGYNKKENIIEVGVKQMLDNPWEDLRKNYGEDTKVSAEVIRLDGNGAFIKLRDNPLEGYCHISQSARGKVEKIEDVFEIGKNYDFLLQKIDERSNRLVFSVKALLIMEEKADMKKYINQDTSGTYSLGDYLNIDKDK